MVCAENSFAQLGRVEQEFRSGSAALLTAEHGPGIGAGNGVGAFGRGRRPPGCGTEGGGRFEARGPRATAERTREGRKQGQRALKAREAWGSHAACAALSVP